MPRKSRRVFTPPPNSKASLPTQPPTPAQPISHPKVVKTQSTQGPVWQNSYAYNQLGGQIQTLQVQKSRESIKDPTAQTAIVLIWGLSPPLPSPLAFPTERTFSFPVSFRGSLSTPESCFFLWSVFPLLCNGPSPPASAIPYRHPLFPWAPSLGPEWRFKPFEICHNGYVWLCRLSPNSGW